ncbi:hypothetical protein B0J14DRAFT_609198 [Halenospora varia]|nr:hypothetical protein B0J14DRAFT_609198 [Halenospora varia]
MSLVGLTGYYLSILSHQPVTRFHFSKTPTKMPNYVKWDAPGVKVTQPGEAEKIQAVSEQFNRFQMMNFNEHHHCPNQLMVKEALRYIFGMKKT